jgi:hypothetical protein
MKGQLRGISEKNQNIVTTQYETFSRISLEFRSSLNPLLSSLRYLADNVIYTPQEQNPLLAETYESAIYLLDNLGKFEESIAV